MVNRDRCERGRLRYAVRRIISTQFKGGLTPAAEIGSGRAVPVVLSHREVLVGSVGRRADRDDPVSSHVDRMGERVAMTEISGDLAASAEGLVERAVLLVRGNYFSGAGGGAPLSSREADGSRPWTTS